MYNEPKQISHTVRLILEDEIFHMVARPNETLEEYVEHFQYNLQRSPYASLPLPDNVLKTTLIREMNE